ncbi:hypothetical protein B0H66DRAFT_304236 [Apodospora peruviana]|uniref:Uncharacterized protein n=1 Tax=Apodospora peruviana TaxID=516989 RepID=A0AAE0M2C1_9PEZI|nr:hypothetical protein B0H66DRAFT_304236 [Apodospora peruviana]
MALRLLSGRCRCTLTATRRDAVPGLLPRGLELTVLEFGRPSLVRIVPRPVSAATSRPHLSGHWPQMARYARPVLAPNIRLYLLSNISASRPVLLDAAWRLAMYGTWQRPLAEMLRLPCETPPRPCRRSPTVISSRMLNPGFLTQSSVITATPFCSLLGVALLGASRQAAERSLPASRAVATLGHRNNSRCHINPPAQPPTSSGSNSAVNPH